MIVREHVPNHGNEDPAYDIRRIEHVDGALVVVDPREGEDNQPRVPNWHQPLALHDAQLVADAEIADLHGPCIEFGNSTGGTIAWNVILPPGFVARGSLVFEAWIAGDGSGNAVADFTIAMLRRRSGDVLGSNFVPLTQGAMVPATLGQITRFERQLLAPGALSDYASDPITLQLTRADDDSYSGSVFLVAARLRHGS